MNWEIAAALGEVIGAVAVIVTVFYLAIQIRYSNKHARAHTEREILNTWRQIQNRFSESEVHTSIMRKGLDDFRSLDLHQRAVFGSMMTDVFDHAESVRRLMEAGLLDSVLYESTKSLCLSIYNTNGGKQWYEEVKSMLIYTPAFERIKSEAVNYPPVSEFYEDA